MSRILLEAEIRQWIEDNRENLSLNVDSWKIEMKERNQSGEKLMPLNFGRYNSSLQQVDTFYKSMSRVITIKDEI